MVRVERSAARPLALGLFCATEMTGKIGSLEEKPRAERGQRRTLSVPLFKRERFLLLSLPSDPRLHSQWKSILKMSIWTPPYVWIGGGIPCPLLSPTPNAV